MFKCRGKLRRHLFICVFPFDIPVNVDAFDLVYPIEL
jgi:hypothetical protein